MMLQVFLLSCRRLLVDYFRKHATAVLITGSAVPGCCQTMGVVAIIHLRWSGGVGLTRLLTMVS